MQKRVTIGFLSIVCLLFFSGMISFFELGHMSRDTDEILKANSRNIYLAKEMLDAAHEQNIALIHLSVLGDRSYDSLCRASLQRLERTLQVAQDEALEKPFLDSLAFATTELRLLTDRYLALMPASAPASSPAAATPAPAAVPVSATDTLAAAALAADSLAAKGAVAREPDWAGSWWYTREYEALYTQLTAAIKSYMTSTQSSLAPRTEQLKKNAYRAVTPVLISLAVMIAIVLMLFYFVNLYCVKPVVRINRSLGDFLAFHVPFAVKADCKDEVLELKEKIESLTIQLKQSKNG